MMSRLESTSSVMRARSRSRASMRTSSASLRRLFSRSSSWVGPASGLSLLMCVPSTACDSPRALTGQNALEPYRSTERARGHKGNPGPGFGQPLEQASGNRQRHGSRGSELERDARPEVDRAEVDVAIDLRALSVALDLDRERGHQVVARLHEDDELVGHLPARGPRDPEEEAV